MFFSQQPTHLSRAEELRQEPPKGTPYSVAIPGTERPGRSKIYRAWNLQNELLKTLDPKVWAEDAHPQCFADLLRNTPVDGLATNPDPVCLDSHGA